MLRAIATAPFSQLYLDGVGRVRSTLDAFSCWGGDKDHSSAQGGDEFPDRCRREARSQCDARRTQRRARARKSLATHTVLAPQAASRHVLKLSLDVPCATTGTGEPLVLDGRMALVRASIVDANNGALISSATDRIAWRVVSGPARMNGVSNGDPRSHEQMKSTQVNAWGGLQRVSKVTEDCVSPGRLAGLPALTPTAIARRRASSGTSPRATPSTIVVAASSSSLKHG